MKMLRHIKLKAFWIKHKLSARLKVLAVLCFIIMFVTPLRNILLPWWPHMLKQLSTFKVIRIHLGDLFYYVDRTLYQGPCDFVHERLQSIKMPKLEEMPVYEISDFIQQLARIKTTLNDNELSILENFKPSLTPDEQRRLLFTMLSATQAFAAFNITYFLVEGSLIGYWRHHGIIPWDDDVDILFDSEKWPLARQVLSCLPGLELNMGSDYMWKLYSKHADLWLGDSNIRFPFIDLFMYKNDSEHIWPICIWMKTEVTMPVDWALPVTTGVFEGYPVYIPRKPTNFLDLHFGPVASDCYSRSFMRRERLLVPLDKRTHISCSKLKHIYPFVVRNKVDKARGTVIEERTLVSKILSTFNTTYHGTLD